MSFCFKRSLLLVHWGSVGAFSHSAPFIRSPVSSSSPLRSPNPPPPAHRVTLRHTPSWYQSKQSKWKSIIVFCHGNVPSCWNGVGWVCTSRANIITVRFPHVEIWSVQPLSWNGSHWSALGLQKKDWRATSNTIHCIVTDGRIIIRNI